jgi:DNA-binding MarR family transcriptional regulator
MRVKDLLALDTCKIAVYTGSMQHQASQQNQAVYQQVATLCTCGNLRTTARLITQLYDAFLQPSGLLVTQFKLLGALAAHGSIALSPLAEQLALDPTTLARNLKPLERDGLVSISIGEDRRTRLVHLTEQGQEVLAKALPLWEEAQAWIINQIGQERWRAMLSDWAALVALARQH